MSDNLNHSSTKNPPSVSGASSPDVDFFPPNLPVKFSYDYSDSNEPVASLASSPPSLSSQSSKPNSVSDDYSDTSEAEGKKESQDEPLILRSSVRTMRDDLAAIQKGLNPEGVKTEKVAEAQPEEKKDVPQEAKLDKPINLDIELGQIEKSRTMEGERAKSFRLEKPRDDFEVPSFITPTPQQESKEVEKEQSKSASYIIEKKDENKLTENSGSVYPIIKNIGSGFSLESILNKIKSIFKRPDKIKEPAMGPPSPTTFSGLKVPKSPRMSINPRLLMIAGALVAVLVIAGVVFFGGTESAVVSPTPLLTNTPDITTEPTPDPQPLAVIFGEPEIFSIPTLSDPLTTFNNFVQAQQVASREMKVFSVEDGDGNKYGFDAFMTRFLIKVPESVLSSIDPNDFMVLVYEPETNSGHEVGFIVKSKDGVKTGSAMRIWEGTISNDFKDIFNFNIGKAATAGFLDNAYKGVPMRYRNFPEPLDTIDYAVITVDGGNYMVIVNSRESIYTVVDKILGN